MMAEQNQHPRVPLSSQYVSNATLAFQRTEIKICESGIDLKHPPRRLEPWILFQLVRLALVPSLESIGQCFLFACWPWWGVNIYLHSSLITLNRDRTLVWVRVFPLYLQAGYYSRHLCYILHAQCVTKCRKRCFGGKLFLTSPVPLVLSSRDKD
jgi:hypothetical protein